MVGRFVFLVAFVYCCSVSVAEEAEEIPLSEVWALQMPGTQDVRELEPPKVRTKHDSLVNQIRKQLTKGRAKDELAGQAFVVQGHGHTALVNAHDILVNHKKPKESFKAGSQLSLVFYTYSSSRYVHLSKVQVSAGSIDVHYKFVPHRTKEMTSHFALMPLGEVPAGKYKVKLARVPLENMFVHSGFKPVDEHYIRRVICQSTMFEVKEKENGN